MVQQHAAMLAFVEAFWVMGVVFLLMLPFLPILQYSKPERSAVPTMKAAETFSASELIEDWPELAPVEDREREHHLVLH